MYLINLNFNYEINVSLKVMENYFYDINFDKMMELVKVDRIDKVKEDILTITGAQDWETVRKLMGNDKYIEKEFLRNKNLFIIYC